jgi:beta-aspartyl-dipeptidase (metallo-type)
MFTLITNGDLYAPEPLGVQSILLAGATIAHIGKIDRRSLEALPLPCQIIDASGCIVAPGLVDAHEHLIGAGGEQGFSSRMPEVTAREIVCAGITTVVGCLGTDMTTRSQTALLGKVRQLQSEGVSAYMYTGGYSIPPQTLTRTITDDLVLVPEVIGFGELAISDTRCSDPTINELGRMVSQAITGGMISGKAGVTHFHIGPGKKRLALLRELLEQHEIPPQYIYPTHVTRTDELLLEAIDLAQRGCFVDTDVIEDDLSRWLTIYREHGGPLSQLTISTDAQTPGGSPARLWQSLRTTICEDGFALSDVLPLATRNPATVLQLGAKGRLEPGADADVLILRRETLEIVHVWARGRQHVADGQFVETTSGEQA